MKSQVFPREGGVAILHTMLTTRNWLLLAVRKIGGTRVLVPGHQNSGAPTFFFGVFLMVFSHLCWQCSDKTRKCQEHINTLRKKEKLIFLKTTNLLGAEQTCFVCSALLASFSSDFSRRCEDWRTTLVSPWPVKVCGTQGDASLHQRHGSSSPVAK